eukprot:138226-Amphidinium_carterae.2
MAVTGMRDATGTAYATCSASAQVQYTTIHPSSNVIAQNSIQPVFTTVAHSKPKPFLITIRLRIDPNPAFCSRSPLFVSSAYAHGDDIAAQKPQVNSR